MSEIPVIFVLDTKGARSKLRLQVKAKSALRLGMHIEYIGQDFIDRFILPDSRIFTKTQEMHP
jgi:hypothetical protein